MSHFVFWIFCSVNTARQPGTHRHLNASKALGTHGRPGRCGEAGVFQQRTFCSHTRCCRGRSCDTILPPDRTHEPGLGREGAHLPQMWPTHLTVHICPFCCSGFCPAGGSRYVMTSDVRKQLACQGTPCAALIVSMCWSLQQKHDAVRPAKVERLVAQLLLALNSRVRHSALHGCPDARIQPLQIVVPRSRTRHPLLTRLRSTRGMQIARRDIGAGRDPTNRFRPVATALGVRN